MIQLTCIALLAAVMLTGTCGGQEKGSTGPLSRMTVFVIPNPESAAETEEFIVNASVAKELQLTHKQMATINHALAHRQAVDDILSPAQHQRLQEMVYQIEVARIGIGESLANGRLGLRIGVREEQNSRSRKALLGLHVAKRISTPRYRMPTMNCRWPT